MCLPVATSSVAEPPSFLPWVTAVRLPMVWTRCYEANKHRHQTCCCSHIALAYPIKKPDRLCRSGFFMQSSHYQSDTRSAAGIKSGEDFFTWKASYHSSMWGRAPFTRQRGSEWGYHEPIPEDYRFDLSYVL